MHLIVLIWSWVTSFKRFFIIVNEITQGKHYKNSLVLFSFYNV